MSARINVTLDSPTLPYRKPKIDIIVDGEIHKTLSFGESTDIEIQNGQHKVQAGVHMSFNMTRKSNTILVNSSSEMQYNILGSYSSIFDSIKLMLLSADKLNRNLNEDERRTTMYCRNCGKSVLESAEICLNCGVRPLAEKLFCQECGVETRPNQEICVKCGVRLKNMQAVAENGGPINTNFSGLPMYYQQEFKKILDSTETYTGKWNWAAFLFSGLWALSKGLWVSFIVALAASIFTYGIAGLVYCIVIGFRGNYLYYQKFVKYKQPVI
ncbi:MAG: hypothetical protein HGA87_04780 [Desulfobulbaceae bacterium]|nr:hypothetical protein [Desulfobulbaceae bacterium]